MRWQPSGHASLLVRRERRGGLARRRPACDGFPSLAVSCTGRGDRWRCACVMCTAVPFPSAQTMGPEGNRGGGGGASLHAPSNQSPYSIHGSARGQPAKGGGVSRAAGLRISGNAYPAQVGASPRFLRAPVCPRCHAGPHGCASFAPHKKLPWPIPPGFFGFSTRFPCWAWCRDGV